MQAVVPPKLLEAAKDDCILETRLDLEASILRGAFSRIPISRINELMKANGKPQSEGEKADPVVTACQVGPYLSTIQKRLEQGNEFIQPSRRLHADDCESNQSTRRRVFGGIRDRWRYFKKVTQATSSRWNQVSL